MTRIIYDISVVLGEQSVDYPGDMPFQRKTVGSIAQNDDYHLSIMKMNAHAGTHIDIPYHFIADNKTIEQYPPRDFIRTAHVVETADNPVQPKAFEHLDIAVGDAVLFKTGNSLIGRCRSGVFSQDFVYLSGSTAAYCVEKKIGLVGLDYISVDKYRDATYPVHYKLLGNGIFILEGIDLARVPEGRYTLSCLPLKIKGAEASPVRAILMK
ncbi:MAG: cyclase family protein [bacterium]|nr:cyclase family protein [bacterium]